MKFSVCKYYTIFVQLFDSFSKYRKKVLRIKKNNPLTEEVIFWIIEKLNITFIQSTYIHRCNDRRKRKTENYKHNRKTNRFFNGIKICDNDYHLNRSYNKMCVKSCFLYKIVCITFVILFSCLSHYRNTYIYYSWNIIFDF